MQSGRLGTIHQGLCSIVIREDLGTQHSIFQRIRKMSKNSFQQISGVQKQDKPCDSEKVHRRLDKNAV